LQTYNLFRRQNEEDLYCAVPEDVPVPPFVTDERWEWAQSLDVSQLSGFDAKAAEISANRNGFYLFHSTDSQGGSGKAGHAGGVTPTIALTTAPSCRRVANPGSESTLSQTEI
jgi:hypothetical protein